MSKNTYSDTENNNQKSIDSLHLNKSLGKNVILLVDDNEEFRREFISFFYEYDIIEAVSGEDALKIINKSNLIDLIILDVNMPGLSGIKTLELIKEMFPDIKIIILTGHSSKETIIKALQGHADNYLEKPLDIEKTKEIIKLSLGQKTTSKSMDANDLKTKIEFIKHYIQKNWFRKVSLKDAADLIYLSPKYFSRFFKKYAKTSFIDYRTSLKMNAAKDLLSKTGYSIYQISDKIGYENTESFVRKFKQYFKCTPSEYKLKNNKQPVKKYGR